jgi:hypothetical protein
MIYYWNSEEISGSLAFVRTMAAALRQGHEASEIQALWKAKRTSEEAREALAELSDYALELAPCWMPA